MSAGTAPEMVTITSGACKLYGKLWKVDASAPTIVLLCGLGFHTFEYELLAPLLCAAQYNCLAFDYRGHGNSAGGRGHWTLEDLADDTHNAIDFVCSRHRAKVGVFGNSLGGMTGMLAALRDERISSVVASNCPARLGPLMLTPYRKYLFGLLKVVDRAVGVRVSVNLFYSYEQLIDDRGWIERIRTDQRIAAARRLSVRAYKSLLEGWDATAVVERIRKPLLILQGRNDRLQPTTESTLIHKAAHEPKELLLIDTGHLPHLESPPLVGQVLTDWFDKTLLGT